MNHALENNWVWLATYTTILWVINLKKINSDFWRLYKIKIWIPSLKWRGSDLSNRITDYQSHVIGLQCQLLGTSGVSCGIDMWSVNKRASPQNVGYFLSLTNYLTYVSEWKCLHCIICQCVNSWDDTPKMLNNYSRNIVRVCGYRYPSSSIEWSLSFNKYINDYYPLLYSIGDSY